MLPVKIKVLAKMDVILKPSPRTGVALDQNAGQNGLQIAINVGDYCQCLQRRAARNGKHSRPHQADGEGADGNMVGDRGLHVAAARDGVVRARKNHITWRQEIDPADLDAQTAAAGRARPVEYF